MGVEGLATKGMTQKERGGGHSTETKVDSESTGNLNKHTERSVENNPWK